MIPQEKDLSLRRRSMPLEKGPCPRRRSILQEREGKVSPAPGGPFSLGWVVCEEERGGFFQDFALLEDMSNSLGCCWSWECRSVHGDLCASTGLSPRLLSQGLIRSHQIKFPVTSLVSLSQWPAGKAPVSKSEK